MRVLLKCYENNTSICTFIYKIVFFNDFYKINDNSQHFNNKISCDRLLLTVIVGKKKN